MANPGSAPIASASEARALPPVSVRGRVRGRGARRALRYRIAPIHGQKVTFVERSAAGEHVIGVARRTNGKVRFAPADGPRGVRRVVAQVSQGGLPRREVRVASYRVDGPQRPPRPRQVRVSRTGDSLSVTWRGSRGALGYEVFVTTLNRRRELFRLPAADRALTIGDVGRADRATVTIAALSAAHLPGSAARVNVRPARP